VTFTQDEGPRRDTSEAALAKLRPAFHATGTVTAGNSSQTSDGAAAVIVTSAEAARDRGLEPFARFVSMYVLKLGVLDGWRGFVLAVLYANYVFLRSAKAWEARRGAGQGDPGAS